MPKKQFLVGDTTEAVMLWKIRQLTKTPDDQSTKRKQKFARLQAKRTHVLQDCPAMAAQLKKFRTLYECGNFFGMLDDHHHQPWVREHLHRDKLDTVQC